MEPTTETLDDILKKLLNAIPEVRAAAIVSAEGLPIASALPQGVDETRIAAMIAAVQIISERAVEELARGNLKRVAIEGVDGLIHLSKAGKNAILVLSAPLDFSEFRRRAPYDKFNFNNHFGPTSATAPVR
ncbi:MAG: roadblock/LC7 domain-containing protein [Promethearchaeota archaeon]